MRTEPDEVHTVKMNVAPGVWAYVDRANARVLWFGGTFALAFGIVGGTALFLLMNDASIKEPFILFSIGYGGSAIIGWIVGLLIGAFTGTKTADKK